MNTEIPDQWANLYSCPNSTTNLFTCGTAGWATSVCEGNVGHYSWQSGNVSVAQVMASSSSLLSSSTITASGTSTTESTSTTSRSTSNSSPTSSLPITAQESSSSPSAVALGTGLGAGLGVPLLITVCLVYFWIRSRQRALSSAETKIDIATQDMYMRPTAQKVDIVGPNQIRELEGSTRAELYGSF